MAIGSPHLIYPKLINGSGTEAQKFRHLQRQDGTGPILPAEDYVQFCGGPTPDWERQGKEPGKADGERVDAKVRVPPVSQTAG